MNAAIIIGAFLGIIVSCRAEDWNYAAQGGDWCDAGTDLPFPKCCGTSQSPIDIDTSAVTYDSTLGNIHFGPGYFNEVPGMLENNGHTMVFKPNLGVDMSDHYFFDGPVADGITYKFVQLHFHWGTKNTDGSEHTVDGAQYSMEMHMVHINTAYDTFAEAKAAADGLAVLGFFMNIENVPFPFKSMANQSKKIRNVDTSTPVSVYLSDFFSHSPNMIDYFTYQGSLTTPTCDEAVTWIVYKEPLSTKQFFPRFLSLLRTAVGKGSPLVRNNYREPQPLGIRVVKSNFEMV